MAIGGSFSLAVILSAVDKLSGPLGRVQGRLARFGKSAKTLGRNLSLGLTLPIALIGAGIIKTASTFESSMNRIEALSGQAGAALNKTRDQAKDLGATTVFSAAQAADAMGNLALAGFNLQEIHKATPPILNLAAAAQMEIAESAQIAAGVLNAYGFEAEETRRVSDVLTQTFTKSATALEDLGEAFKLSAPIARGMGIEFEELAATLGLLGNNMFRGSLSGTAIRNALVNLANATPKTIKVLGSLGLSLSDFVDKDGDVKSIANTIGLLGKASATTGQLVAIFGKRAGPAMASLVKEGRAELERMTVLMGSSSEGIGRAAQIATIQMRGAGGAMARFRAAVEAAAIAIADSGLLQWFTDTTEAVGGWFTELSKTNPELLKTGVIIAGVTAVAGPAIFAVGALAATFNALAIASGTLGAALATLTLNPIGAALVSIGALVVFTQLLVRNWDAMIEGAKSLTTWIGNKLAPAFDFLGTQIASLVDLMPDWMLRLLNVDPSSVGSAGRLAAAAPGPNPFTARGAAATFASGEAGRTPAESVLRAEIVFRDPPAGVEIVSETGEILPDAELGLSLAIGG